MKPLTALLVAGGVVLVVRAYAADAASSGRPTTGAPRDSATPRVVPDAFLRAIGEFEAAIRGFPSSSADPALVLDSSGRPFSGFLALADQGVQRPFLGGGSQNDVLATRVGAPNRGSVTPLTTVMPATTGGFASSTFDPDRGAFFPGGDEPGEGDPSDPSDPSAEPGPTGSIDVSPTTEGVIGVVGGLATAVASGMMGNPLGVIGGLTTAARAASGMVSVTAAPAPSHALSPTIAAQFASQRAAERGFVDEPAPPTSDTGPTGGIGSGAAGSTAATGDPSPAGFSESPQGDLGPSPSPADAAAATADTSASPSGTTGSNTGDESGAPADPGGGGGASDGDGADGGDGDAGDS